MRYELLRTPAVFVVLIAATSAFMPFPNAVEFLAISFFAGIGSFEIYLAHAQAAYQKAQQTRSVTSSEYSPSEHPQLIVFAIFAGAFLAAGGGMLRRFFESVIAGTFSLLGSPFDHCYVPPSISWPALDRNWFAVMYGILFGILCGWLTTHRPGRQTHLEVVSKKLDEQVSIVDGFGTGFFAAFGVQAAILFSDGLPFGLWSGMYATHPVLVIPAIVLIAMIFAPLTACGGGFCKQVIVELAYQNFPGLWRKLTQWARQWLQLKTTKMAATIGGLGGLLYTELHLTALQFSLFSSSASVSPCLVINGNLLLFVTFTSGVLGAYLWVSRLR